MCPASPLSCHKFSRHLHWKENHGPPCSLPWASWRGDTSKHSLLWSVPLRALTPSMSRMGWKNGESSSKHHNYKKEGDCICGQSGSCRSCINCDKINISRSWWGLVITERRVCTRLSAPGEGWGQSQDLALKSGLPLTSQGMCRKNIPYWNVKIV